MKRFLFALMLTTAAHSSHAGEQANQRLAELLRPTMIAGMLPSQPTKFREPRPIVRPVSLAKLQATPPRPALGAARAVLPYSPPEPPPLATYVAEPSAPQTVILPTVALVAVPSTDAAVPPPLPILAKPTNDRAPLSDATLEASIKAALAKIIPLRGLPVPFAPTNLPDPFELQTPIRLQAPPPEDTQPMAVPPRVLVKELQK